MKDKVDALTVSSLDNLLLKIRTLAARPCVEFSKFEAMELLEAIKNTARDNNHAKANYYKIACDTLRAKLHDCTDEQFQAYLLPVLGDKDQEKVLEIMTKVEKNRSRRGPGWQGNTQFRNQRRYMPYRPIKCFYCAKIGHTKQTCYKWKQDQTGPAISQNKKN